MSHPSKVKGSTFERELVAIFSKHGLIAERAYASNGRALGCAETVDVLASGCRVQCKRRKKIAEWLTVPKGADVVAVREDRGETWIVLEANAFAALVARAGGW